MFPHAAVPSERIIICAVFAPANRANFLNHLHTNRACPVARIISRTKGGLGPFNLRRISGRRFAGRRRGANWIANMDSTGDDAPTWQGLEREENDRCEDKQINSVQAAAGIADTWRRATSFDKYERRTLSSSLKSDAAFIPRRTLDASTAYLNETFYLLLV